MDFEKVSVNLNDEKLSKIDLLISEGFYSNRSAFINEAVDMLLDQKTELVEKIMENNIEVFNPNMWFIGIQNLSKDYLESCKQKNIQLKIKCFGILYIDKDVTLELVKETISEISKKVKVRGSSEICQHLKSIN